MFSYLLGFRILPTFMSFFSFWHRAGASNETITTERCYLKLSRFNQPASLQVAKKKKKKRFGGGGGGGGELREERGSARYCRGPLLPQPPIAATNFDIVLEYLDKRTNEPGRLKTTGRRACLQCTGLRVPIPADMAKTSAGGRPFSLCKRFSRQ